MKDVAVDEFAADRLGPHLVEEQVAQAVVNESSVVELEALRLVRLTSADGHGPRLRRSPKSFPLRGRRRRNVILMPLEREDRQKAVVAQPPHVLGKAIGPARIGAGEL